MKFYFCQGCGKRITETEVQAGEGKDKKLKGVYCRQCAIGITTMDTLPMGDGDAKRILSQEEKAPPERRPRRTTGQAKLPPSGNRRPSRRAIPRPPAGRNTWLGIGLGVVVIAVVGVVFLARSGGPREPRVRKSDGQRESTTASQSNVDITSKTSREKNASVAEAEPTASESHEPAGKERAPDDARSVTSPDGKSVDQAGHTESPTAKQDERPSTVDNPKPEDAPATSSGGSGKTAVSPESGGAREPGDAEHVQKPVPDAQAEYVAFLGEFLDDLRRGDFATATRILKEVRSRPVMRPVKDRLDVAEQAVTWMNDLNGAVRKGALKLKEKDRFSLKPAKGQTLIVGNQAEFRVDTVSDTAVLLKHRKQGFSIECKLSELHMRTRMALAELGLGDDRDGWVRRAFARLLGLYGTDAQDNGAPDGVRKAIGRAEKAGLGEGEVSFLKACLEIAERGAAEVQAEKLLADFDALFQAKKWKAAETVGRKLKTDYGSTQALRGNADFSKRLETAIHKGLPVQEYTVTVQQGAAIAEVGLEAYTGTRMTCLYKFHPDLPGKNKGRTGGNGHWFILIGFALLKQEGGPLPDETEILEANLHLRRRGGWAQYVELRRVLTPWKASEAGWNMSARGVKWKAPGGDVSKDVAGSSELPGSDGAKVTWRRFDVTEDLREALKAGKSAEWRVGAYRSRARSGYVNTLDYFTTTEKDIKKRPKLVLRIRCPKLRGARTEKGG